MPFGKHRGWSEFITGRQARELHAASSFASIINRPLLYRIHINWDRTALREDIAGVAGATYRSRIARWLRHPDQGTHAFYAIYVRERPPSVTAKPNDHIHLHIPPDLVGRFLEVASGLMPKSALPLGYKAIVVDRIGLTTNAREGALAYLLKGTAPKAAQLIRRDGLLNIEPQFQGRIDGKRCGVTETLGRSARAQYDTKSTSREVRNKYVA